MEERPPRCAVEECCDIEHRDVLERHQYEVRDDVHMRYDDLQWRIWAVQKESKEALYKSRGPMVAKMEQVRGYGAALQHDQNKAKGIYQAEGRAMKEHNAKAEGELTGQIES